MYELPPISDIWFDRSDLKEVSSLYSDRISEWKDFVPQLFGKLLFNSQVVEKPVEEQCEWVKNAFKMLEDNPDWRSIASASSYHPELAVENTVELSRMVAESMGLKNLEPRNNEKPEELDKLLKKLKSEGKDVKDLKKKIRTARAKRSKAVMEAESNNRLAKKMSLLSGTSSDKKEAVAVLRSFGLVGDKGNLKESIPKSLIDLLCGSKELMKLIRSLGGLREARAKNELMSPSKRGVSIHGVKNGDKVEDLLSSELVKLTDPLLSLDLLDRLQNKKALVWNKKGKSPKENGDVIMMVDKSSSMSFPVDSSDESLTINHWASSVAAAAVLKAVKGNRRVEVIFFNGGTESVKVNGAEDLEEFFEALSSAPSGGTNIGRAMEGAGKAILKLRKPQALMISDMEIPSSFKVEPKLDCRLELVLVSDHYTEDDKDRIKDQIGANDVMVIAPSTIGSTHRHSLASDIVERV